MDYVVPYLRNHSRANLPSYRACSKLLAALSEYQVTLQACRGCAGSISNGTKFIVKKFKFLLLKLRSAEELLHSPANICL